MGLSVFLSFTFVMFLGWGLSRSFLGGKGAVSERSRVMRDTRKVIELGGTTLEFETFLDYLCHGNCAMHRATSAFPRSMSTIEPYPNQQAVSPIFFLIVELKLRP